MNILKKITSHKGQYFVLKGENGEKFFEKKLSKSIKNEIYGYELIKDFYRVPKLVSFDFTKNEIIYEYNDNLFNKTLHKGLFENIPFDMEKIIDSITPNFNNFELLNEDFSVNSCFFKGRILNIQNYLKSNLDCYEKTIICNDMILPNFKTIVNDIIINISKNQIVPTVISQGDPTDLNISVDGTISDFEVAGKNSLINEIAIFIGCYIVNCYYFYIKYIDSPHKYYTKTLNSMSEFIKLDYKETNEQIIVNFSQLIPPNVKEFILAYLEKIKSLGVIASDFNLGAYVAMRMISPVDVDKIEDKKDKYLLFSLAGLFDTQYKTLNKIIEFIAKI